MSEDMRNAIVALHGMAMAYRHVVDTLCAGIGELTLLFRGGDVIDADTGELYYLVGEGWQI